MPVARATGALFERLKLETRPAHDVIEAALGLTSESLSSDTYRHTLERFYGFYCPVEADLRALGGWAGRGLNLGARQKTPLLEADLRALGLDAPGGLPVCTERPALADAAAAFGCLYVLEGATLGGQLIRRHVRARLGVTPESGGRFFYGYGEQTGATWQAFRSALTAFATTRDTQDAVVVTAVATFYALHSWCQRSRPR